MGSDNLFRKRNERIKRKIDIRKPEPSFLIVCEGERTEPIYFKAFKLQSAKVKVFGAGYNTLSLVKKTIELKEKAREKNEIYEQVWSVFDRDSFPKQDFNAAFDLAKKKEIKIAYSNEAFELWYLLHFHYYNSGISREKYEEKLTKLLKHKYEKKSRTIYAEIIDKQDDAIRNAQKLLETYEKTHNPEKDNPSTTVHHLVQELNKYL